MRNGIEHGEIVARAVHLNEGELANHTGRMQYVR
jgi:hypothetical protein